MAISIAVVAELRRLPSARAFPAKRHRGFGFVSGGAGTLPACGCSKLAAQAALDPTAFLLAEAASQLSHLVKQHVQRRMLRTGRRPGGASRLADDSDTSGSSSDEDVTEAAPRRRLLLGDEPSQLCSSMGAADSTSVASTSVGGGAGSTSLPDSGQVSLGAKRVRMQRQYAIDLAGQCLLGGERLPLPPPPGPAN